MVTNLSSLDFGTISFKSSLGGQSYNSSRKITFIGGLHGLGYGKFQGLLEARYLWIGLWPSGPAVGYCSFGGSEKTVGRKLQWERERDDNELCLSQLNYFLSINGGDSTFRYLLVPSLSEEFACLDCRRFFRLPCGEALCRMFFIKEKEYWLFGPNSWLHWRYLSIYIYSYHHHHLNSLNLI